MGRGRPPTIACDDLPRSRCTGRKTCVWKEETRECSPKSARPSMAKVSKRRASPQSWGYDRKLKFVAEDHFRKSHTFSTIKDAVSRGAKNVHIVAHFAIASAVIKGDKARMIITYYDPNSTTGDLQTVGQITYEGRDEENRGSMCTLYTNSRKDEKHLMKCIITALEDAEDEMSAQRIADIELYKRKRRGR